MIKKLLVSATMILLAFNGIALGQVEENQDTTQSTIVKMYQDIEVFKRLKVSGYIQAQYQYADSFGIITPSGGPFPAGSDKRFSIRRGRIKFQYDGVANDKGINTSQYVLQIDVSERGLALKDAYVKLTDPWIGWVSLTAGMQNRPFGFELNYTSSARESPEYARMSQLIMPNEEDLGAMITIQGPKWSLWNWIKLDAGMFNGTGVQGAGVNASDFDKYKDFIGRLSINKSTPSEKMKYGFGVSYYDGGYRIDTVNVYSNGADANGVNGFVRDNAKSEFYNVTVGNRGKTKRVYTGVDAQFSVDWFPGITTIRAEYIEGNQPGFTSAASPATATLSPFAATLNDIYNRNFNGAYFYFLQNIFQTPLQLIVKYDWYDPNTDVKGDDIGKGVVGTNKSFTAADIRYDTWGYGLAYRWDSNVKITAYYDMVKNETSTNVAGFGSDLNDNVFTLRLQVKF